MAIAKMLTFILFTVFLHSVSTRKFPSKLDRCHLSDPNFSKCVDRAIENAMRVLGKSAIPSANLPLLDPLAISELTIGAGNNAVHLVQNYHDIKLHGFSTAKVENTHLDLERKLLTFKSFFKQLRQEAKYDINGKVIILPMVGNGDATLILEDVYVDSTVHFKEMTKNNKTFFEVMSYDCTLTPKDCHCEFLNLFNGDERLAGPVTKVIEENCLELFNDVKEGVEKAYGEVFKQITKRFFDTYPLDEIFLP